MWLVYLKSPHFGIIRCSPLSMQPEKLGFELFVTFFDWPTRAEPWCEARCEVSHGKPPNMGACRRRMVPRCGSATVLNQSIDPNAQNMRPSRQLLNPLFPRERGRCLTGFQDPHPFPGTVRLPWSCFTCSDWHCQCLSTLMNQPMSLRVQWVPWFWSPSLILTLAPNQDPPQSGYLPNHNIAPSLLTTYTKNWNAKFNSNEKLFSMPVVYTPSGSTTEIVIIGSIQNIVRVINSSTGAIIASKTLDAAYLSSDSNCNDGATVGITGTPVIDNTTGTSTAYILLVQFFPLNLLGLLATLLDWARYVFTAKEQQNDCFNFRFLLT